MLKDTPYNVLKQDERAYAIMLLRDQCDSTLSEIAREFKISPIRVLQIYRKVKHRQIGLYIHHISIALGYDGISQIRAVYEKAYECYQDKTYACAYLEKKYKGILGEYRNGEPGMPEYFLKRMPPLKAAFGKKTVARIIEMKENENASFVEIAKELRMTRQKAKHLYDGHYHGKLLEILERLQEQAESEQEKREIWESCFKNNYSLKKRYEMLVEKESSCL